MEPVAMNPVEPVDKVVAEIHPWRCGEPWQHPIPRDKKNKNHWEKCHDVVQKYDEEKCDAWKDEIEKLLIFAGLFSATVTAFTIESYKWLDEDPSEMTNRLLLNISLQIHQQVNNVSTSIVPDSVPFSVSSSVVRINIFWFLSLTLSMTTVLVGILCTQWLREFLRDAARSHKDAVALRQMRSEGLEAWKVPQILSALPLLLQLSVVLFFAGILELLWARNWKVALAITIVAGMAFLFLVTTTMLPALQSIFISDPHLRVGQCPYKSPQSWAFYQLVLRLVLIAKFLHARWSSIKFFLPESTAETPVVEPDTAYTSTLAYFGRFAKEVQDIDWVEYDIRWRYMRDASYFDFVTGYPREPQDEADILHGLTWVDKTFTQDIDMVYMVYHCLQDLESPQAAQVVSDLDPVLADLPKLLFPERSDSIKENTFYDVTPASHLQRREHIFAVFLRLHKHLHPSINTFYLESVIRLINTSAQCVPYIVLRESDHDLQGLPDDILEQLFMSLRTIISHDSITEEHGSQIWGFLRDLFQQKRTSVSERLLTITFDIFEEFHHWLTQSEESRVRRVEICVAGIIWIFSLLDTDTVETLRAMKLFRKAEELALALDHCIVEYQGASKVLRGLRIRRWPDLKKKILPAQRTLELDSAVDDSSVTGVRATIV